MNNEKFNCPKCYNTGTYCVANGEDDFDMELCDCIYGEQLENKDPEYKLGQSIYN